MSDIHAALYYNSNSLLQSCFSASQLRLQRAAELVNQLDQTIRDSIVAYEEDDPLIQTMEDAQEDLLDAASQYRAAYAELRSNPQGAELDG